MQPQSLDQATEQSQQQPTPEEILAANNQALLKKRQLANQQNNTFTPAQISQALAQVNPNSKDPKVQIGKAIETPNYAGLCLKWVDDQQGNQNRLPNAYADYQTKSQAGLINNSDKIPSGARVYFSPNDSNNNMGHVGIYQGNGSFVSATDSGIKTFSIKDWEKATGQTYLGFSISK